MRRSSDLPPGAKCINRGWNERDVWGRLVLLNFAETTGVAMNPSSLPGLAAIAGEPIARRSLEAGQCALAVIDMQEKLLPAIFNREELVRNSRVLIRLAAVLEIPVLLTTQYVRGLGPTVPEIAELLPHVTPIDKMDFSCFGREEYRTAMRDLPGCRTTLLLCGIESHICVMQTALGALDNGYMVHVASDAVGSRSERNWRLGLDRMESAGCVLSSTEMMMYELLRRSGTAEFKEMLQYIK
jgi:nicotinamidase-related amidase